jgi:hypothetical protein
MMLAVLKSAPVLPKRMPATLLRGFLLYKREACCNAEDIGGIIEEDACCTAEDACFFEENACCTID